MVIRVNKVLEKIDFIRLLLPICCLYFYACGSVILHKRYSFFIVRGNLQEAGRISSDISHINPEM